MKSAFNLKTVKLLIIILMVAMPGNASSVHHAQSLPVEVSSDTAATPMAWSSGGPYGGYVNCVAMDTSNPDIIYAGTRRGMYKTVDAGSRWSVTPFLPIPVYVIQVAVDNTNVLFAGTDDGVYRSGDGGSSWAQRGLAGETVHALAIHPDNSDVVFAGNTLWPSSPDDDGIVGVFQSTDGGQSWQPKHTSAIRGVESLLIDTNDTSIIYAGVHNGSEWPAGLRKSTDGGETWVGVTVGPYWPWDDVVALAMTPAGHEPATLYAVGRSDVYKSTDQGDSWAPTQTPWISPSPPWALTVDPRNPDTIYVGTRYYQGDIYRSVNGGETWSVKASGLMGRSPSGLLVDPRNTNVYAGLEEGGVSKTTNMAEQWHPINEGMANTYIVGLAADPSSGTAFAAITKLHGAITTDCGGSWSYLREIPVGLGALAVAPSNPLSVWAGDGLKRDSNFYVYKSTDGGTSWISIKFLEVIGDPLTTGVTDILVSSADSQCVLVGTSGVLGILARTRTGGLSWSQLGGHTTALAADPNSPDLVYRGRVNPGQVFAISNACGSYSTEEITPEAGIGDVRDIEVGSGSEVYVAASDGLWRRDGSSWVILSGLPTADITAVAIDRSQHPDVLYAGTAEDGVYVSTDEGATWSATNEGLGNLAVTKLAIGSSPTRRLYAGTEYGGVWSMAIGIAAENVIYLPLLFR